MERSVFSRKPWNLRARSLVAKLGIAAVLAGVAVPLVSPAPASAFKSYSCQIFWEAESAAGERGEYAAQAYWRQRFIFSGC
jgi:hypothetical protein